MKIIPKSKFENKLTHLLSDSPKTEKKQATRSEEFDIFKNFKNNLKFNQNRLKDQLIETGLGKYFEKFVSEGIVQCADLRSLSIQDLNCLRIPARDQQKIREQFGDLQVQRSDLVKHSVGVGTNSAAHKEGKSTINRVLFQRKAEPNTQVIGEFSRSAKYENPGKAKQQHSVSIGTDPMPDFTESQKFPSNSNSDQQTSHGEVQQKCTFKENNKNSQNISQNAFKLTNNLKFKQGDLPLIIEENSDGQSVNKENWLENLGNTGFNIMNMFASNQNHPNLIQENFQNQTQTHSDTGTSTPKFFDIDSLQFNPKESQIEACFTCFDRISKSDALVCPYQPEHVFCSQICLDTRLNLASELCSVCFKEAPKFDMLFEQGFFLCNEISCISKLQKFREDFKPQADQVIGGVVDDSNLEEIFNF